MPSQMLILPILADSMEQLLEALRILREEAAKVGLHINWNKTKIMAIDPSCPTVNSPLNLDSSTGIEAVQDFTYLGCIISSSGSLLPELQAILSKVSSIMGRLNHHLWRKPKHQSHNETADIQSSSRLCDALRS